MVSVISNILPIPPNTDLNISANASLNALKVSFQKSLEKIFLNMLAIPEPSDFAIEPTSLGMVFAIAAITSSIISGSFGTNPAIIANITSITALIIDGRLSNKEFTVPTIESTKD